MKVCDVGREKRGGVVLAEMARYIFWITTEAGSRLATTVTRREVGGSGRGRKKEREEEGENVEEVARSDLICPPKGNT